MMKSRYATHNDIIW